MPVAAAFAVSMSSALAAAAWTLVYGVAAAATLLALVLARNHLTDPWRRIRNTRGVKLLPFVWGVPVFGIVPGLLRAARGGSGLPYFATLFAKAGETFACRVWGDTVVYTIDKDVAMHVISTGFRKGAFEKGPYMRQKYRPWLGDGIFTSDGDAWKKQRAFAKELFHSVNMKHHVETFDAVARRLADRFDGLIATAHAADGAASAVIDVQDYFMRYTLDTFVKIGLGAEAGAIEEDHNRFAVAFDSVQTTLNRRHLYGVLSPLLERLSGYGGHLAYMNRFAETIINDLQQKSTEELAQSKDLLSRMLVLQREQQAQGAAAPQGELVITAKFLRDSVMNFLVAGRDTTAVTLTFCTYLLSRHPAVMAKVRAEFEAVIGDGPVTLDKIRECRYTKRVLQETLRLFPPVPGDGYEATRDEVLPGGYLVPKSQRVYFLTYIMQRQESLYPEPNAFKPERWDAPGAVAPTPPNFLSFHGGPRVCLGQDMAYVEATVALWVMLRRFDFEYVHGDAEPALKTAIILTCKNGMPMKVTPRGTAPRSVGAAQRR